MTAMIRTAFAEALGEPLPDTADFFAHGGDSVAAEQVLAALSARLAMELPGWLLLDHPTAAGLAAVLTAAAAPET
jgi:hypothetical protein